MASTSTPQKIFDSTVINLPVPATWKLIVKNAMAFMSSNPSTTSLEVIDGPKNGLANGSVWKITSKDGKVQELDISVRASDFVLSWKDSQNGQVDQIQLKKVTEDDTSFLTWTTVGAPADVDLAELSKARKSFLVGLSSSLTEKYWKMSRVRKTFIDFFCKKQAHTNYKSSPTVPRDDPTLLFANAGMNQFKPIFMGQVPEGSDMEGMTRAANSQKCIRAGGKHNDLEDVGFDVYHHTFFEMLGNWSFGDYFKEEAIGWAWELLTKVYKLPEGRLYATYFGGDEKMGLAADNEARDIWRKYLPDDRILPFDKVDNFWEMGATGPCGPCTEIHFDRIGGPASERGPIVNADDPNLLEIWNLVFMQYNRLPNGALQNLPKASVDTGMGFERLTSVLQNKTSNYDTDIFAPIFAEIEKLADPKVRKYAGHVGETDTDRVDMAYRVIADHIRTLTFSITDGAVPGANGRNYVLRRVLRRAVRFGTQQLGCKPGFMCKLVDCCVQHFKSAFPEIASRQAYVTGVINNEEQNFNRTLSKGLRMYKKETGNMRKAGQTTMPAAAAYKLWSTYGFPKELTELMLVEEKLAMCPEAEYKGAAEAQKEESRKGAKGADMDGMKLEANETSGLLARGVTKTESKLKYEWHIKPEATVKALYLGMGKFTDSVTDSSGPVGVVLDQSSFYYTSGGQVTDAGCLLRASAPADAAGATKASDADADDDEQAIFKVNGCELFGKYVLHIGSVGEGCTLTVGDKICCSVDYEKRGRIVPNHTMTHVLNLALRQVAGEQTDQKGALYDEEKLRFDFNGKALTTAQLSEVEKICNDLIKDALVIDTQEVPFVKAETIAGLRCAAASYPETVRVVTVGVTVETVMADPTNPKWKGFSVELCGGNHLSNSSEAQSFAILKEESIQEGVRRVICVTGERAVEAKVQFNALEVQLEEASTLSGPTLDSRLKDLSKALSKAVIPIAGKRMLREKHAALEKKLIAQKKAMTGALKAKATAAIAQQLADAGDKTCLVIEVDLGTEKKLGATLLKKTLKKRKKTSLMLLSCNATKGVSCIASVSKVHQGKGLKASEWVGATVKVCGGSAGGKDAMAQGNGKDVSKKDEALKVAQGIAEKYA